MIDDILLIFYDILLIVALGYEFFSDKCAQFPLTFTKLN